MTDPAAQRETGRETPQLTIVVYADGRASVGGVPVVVPDGGDLAAVRGAALSTALGMAVRQGRPLRALAFEPDGSTWPLLLHPDGRVEEDAEAAEHDPSGRTGGRTPPAGVPTALPASPASPRGPRTQTIVLNAQWSDAVETPEAPERFRDRLARISEAGGSGRIEAALTLAADLEREVALLFGSSHPHVLQARAVRAHIITLANDWTRAADLYLALTADWLELSGDRSAQVRQCAANAHYCWLRVTDPEEYERIGEAVVRIWLKVPGTEPQLRAARRHRDQLRSRDSLGR
ncbi:hypothetical protein OG562_23160 [Streptomyces sp. NBC_01275]|uniref:hypothetical protein n=1 Tax=Streptomyces sp. NBC_01275 TaxID=2903807 RepID=UPI00225C1C80|nr:hypothetical protein [Streptomyces sp. NBC_01275]MCX4763813.1 hypothetical protein [Streptomyces sp. NBC_01275]